MNKNTTNLNELGYFYDEYASGNGLEVFKTEWEWQDAVSEVKFKIYITSQRVQKIKKTKIHLPENDAYKTTEEVSLSPEEAVAVAEYLKKDMV